MRESPALIIIEQLQQRGAKLSYMDPYVRDLHEEGIDLKSENPRGSFSAYDLVVVVTDHTDLDRARLLSEAKLIVDTRDVLRGVPGERSHVYGL